MHQSTKRTKEKSKSKFFKSPDLQKAFSGDYGSDSSTSSVEMKYLTLNTSTITFGAEGGSAARGKDSFRYNEMMQGASIQDIYLNRLRKGVVQSSMSTYSADSFGKVPNMEVPTLEEPVIKVDQVFDAPVMPDVLIEPKIKVDLEAIQNQMEELNAIPMLD